MADDLLALFPELAGATFRVGLVSQGHVPTIERMLADGKSWVEIGAVIGWCPRTAEDHWRTYRAAAAIVSQ